MVGQHQVVWTNSAKAELRNIYDYVKETSVQNADKFLDDIMLAVEKASDHAGTHPSDKFKIDNDVSFRAFELHRCRISYRVAKDVLQILRVRHTKRVPKLY